MSNKNEDRGMMKWAPFASVMSEAEIRSAVDKKYINEKPEFSEDQIMELEEKIVYAFNNKKEVIIKIYDKYYDIEEKGIIIKIDALNKTINLDGKIIYFDKILDVKII